MVDPLEEDKVYHRPPSHEKIRQYMERLCEFANTGPESEFHHPIVKAIVLHFMLGYVHPFVDGNGRLARALMYWYSLKHDYWLFEHLAISKAIKQSRGRYGMAYLHTETDDNDVTYFINYNLECMEKVLEDTKRYLQKKQHKRREAMTLADAHLELNLRQAEILKDIVSRRGGPVSISEMMTKFNVVHQTARTDLLLLAELGLLEKKKVGNKMYFRYSGGADL